MGKIILAFPPVLGILLATCGIFLLLYRRNSGVPVTGTVVDVIYRDRKFLGIKVSTETPVVRYEINGETVSAVSRRAVMEGTAGYKKGKRIDIRVNRRNIRKFAPSDSGGVSEKLLIACGVSIIVSWAVMLVRYF